MADNKRHPISGLGRRKTSVARVHMREGTGKIVVNGLDKEVYFKNKEDIDYLLKPLKITKNETKFDVVINVKGGGYKGQAGAIVLGLSRGLLQHDGSLLETLKEYGLLTRDARMKERKKYGLHGARRATQFSKR